jgi:putative flavoprotein involved in K+ transport
MNQSKIPSHVEVVIVGGGQSGLSLSYYLQKQGRSHVVIEKNSLVHSWKSARWDNFCLVTPNWQCDLPGWPYQGKDPDGFMKREEIITYLEGFVEHVNAPTATGVKVTQVSPLIDGGFSVTTSNGDITADQVVVASGAYHQPVIPRMAEKLPKELVQLHSEQYRKAADLPSGTVLVVGNGQSGAQIAEDLHLAGRKVVLATGDAPRCARFYRGKDVVTWLADMGYYDMPVEDHPLREGVRDNTNHYVTGRDGGRDIDLRKFALEGMELYGLMTDVEGDELKFIPNLSESLNQADAVYNRINATIDRHIEKNGISAPPGTVYEPVWQPAQERTSLNLKAAGITSVIWCIGFTPDFKWVNASVFNGIGEPVHYRGVTAQPGLYFLGLPWLHTWGSGRFSGVSRDAQYLSEKIANYAVSKMQFAGRSAKEVKAA